MHTHIELNQYSAKLILLIFIKSELTKSAMSKNTQNNNTLFFLIQLASFLFSIHKNEDCYTSNNGNNTCYTA